MREISRNRLKYIAAITMLTDHVAEICIKNPEDSLVYILCRVIGRMSFPIFAFLLVQGFLTTSDRKKYLTRITVFAFLSEIPFDIAFYDSMFYWGQQNVLFTMMLGLLLLSVLERYPIMGTVGKTGIVFCVALVGAAMRVDYSWFGVVLIGLFYLLQNRLNDSWNIAIFTLITILYGQMELWWMLSLPILCSYYGQKKEKKQKKTGKYFFYFFYPMHLLILKMIVVCGFKIDFL